MATAPEIDFAAEGLLDDLDGGAREARLVLLSELAADGVPLEELRDAVNAGRLALLPVERALAGDGRRYTAREVAEIVGRTPAACRQLASSARRRIGASRAPAAPAAQRGPRR